MNGANSLHLIFSNMNGYFEEFNEKKYDELWSKIRDLISSITKKLHDYDEKYMKIKFDFDDDLPLNKTMRQYRGNSC